MKNNFRIKEMARKEIKNIGFIDTEIGEQVLRLIENIAIYYYQEGYKDAKDDSI